jgi:hypothetical protein
MDTQFIESDGQIRKRDFATGCAKRVLEGYTPLDSRVWKSEQPAAMALRDMMEQARVLRPEHNLRIDLWAEDDLVIE